LICTKIFYKFSKKHLIGINDLQSISEHFVPEIIFTQNILSKQRGIKFVGMSGSGPTCFGIFNKKNDAVNAVINIKKLRPLWWAKQGKVLH
jgi:4-diphosphocytidyl-2-C-methyl-D-erythritol kinase